MQQELIRKQFDVQISKTWLEKSDYKLGKSQLEKTTYQTEHRQRKQDNTMKNKYDILSGAVYHSKPLDILYIRQF